MNIKLYNYSWIIWRVSLEMNVNKVRDLESEKNKKVVKYLYIFKFFF